jgi:hypothetical protein
MECSLYQRCAFEEDRQRPITWHKLVVFAQHVAVSCSQNSIVCFVFHWFFEGLNALPVWFGNGRMFDQVDNLGDARKALCLPREPETDAFAKRHDFGLLRDDKVADGRVARC